MPPVIQKSDVARLATISGIAITLIGWTDLIMLWFPLRPASAEWEFGSTSSFIDALPLATLGLILLALVSLTEMRRRALRVIAIFAAFVSVSLIGIGIIYASGLPLALQAVQMPMREVLFLSIIKTVILATIYLIFYISLAVISWRRANAIARTSSSRRS
jgi:hypothetical protein